MGGDKAKHPLSTTTTQYTCERFKLHLHLNLKFVTGGKSNPSAMHSKELVLFSSRVSEPNGKGGSRNISGRA